MLWSCKWEWMVVSEDYSIGVLSDCLMLPSSGPSQTQVKQLHKYTVQDSYHEHIAKEPRSST